MARRRLLDGVSNRHKEECSYSREPLQRLNDRAPGPASRMHTQQSMEEMHTRVFAQLNNLLDESNRDVLQVLALVVILLLGVVDYWTGPEIAFSTFYLLPLAAIACK